MTRYGYTVIFRPKWTIHRTLGNYKPWFFLYFSCFLMGHSNHTSIRSTQMEKHIFICSSCMQTNRLHKFYEIHSNITEQWCTKCDFSSETWTKSKRSGFRMLCLYLNKVGHENNDDKQKMKHKKTHTHTHQGYHRICA